MLQSARSTLCLTLALLLFTPHTAMGGGLVYTSQNGSGVFKESSGSSNLGLGRSESALVAIGLALGSLTIALTIKLTVGQRQKNRSRASNRATRRALGRSTETSSAGEARNISGS